MPSFNQRLGVTRYEADEVYRKALESYKKSDYDDAVVQMNEAIRLLPTRAEYYAARGMMYLEDDAADEARADFEQALKRFDFELLALYGLGLLAYRAKRADEAIRHLQRAFYADQKRPEPPYTLALAYLLKRDFAKATEWMTRANTLFEAANDRRKSDSARWLREIGRLASGKVGSRVGGADRATTTSMFPISGAQPTPPAADENSDADDEPPDKSEEADEVAPERDDSKSEE